ncbi:MAG TPA: hypothetical protein VGM23_10200, partial [Armatimonadota bacterium]
TDPEENAKHVLFFHGLLREAGVDVPIIDINHFAGKENIPDLISPGGAYIVNCFGSEGDFWTLNLERWEKHDRPMMTIETMGGMFGRFYDWPYYSNTNGYQGPIVKPEYLEAVSYQHLAEGWNGINYYVFVDGQHPQEGGERMLPERDMNYQAPITAVGTLRESYRTVKRIGWFLRAFENDVLRSKPTPSWMHAVAYGQAHPGSEENGDLFELYHAQGKEIPDALRHVSTIKALGRATKGLNLSESNFAFLFNISTRGSQWKRDIRLTTSPRGIPCEVSSEYPRRVQLSLPPQRSKCVPFYVKLAERTFLEYSTAELLDRRPFGAGVQLILHADADESVETRLVLPGKAPVTHTGEALAHWESPNTLMLIALPGENLQVTTIAGERPLRVVLMERRLAGYVWDLATPTGSAVAAANITILESTCAAGHTRARVQLAEADIFFHLLNDQAPRISCPELPLTGSYDAQSGVYSATGSTKLPAPEIAFTKRREGDCWIWEAPVSPALLDGLAELVLHAEYDGECARAYLNGTLISDHYWGRFQYWELGLKNWLTGPATLRLEFEQTRHVDLRPRPIVETWLEIDWVAGE